MAFVLAKQDSQDQGGLSYLPGFDGMRFGAFLLVLVWHVTSTTGWYGVDLFFVLSGFLISRILIVTRDGTHYFRRFYVRRALRIFPLYYVFLLSNPLGKMSTESATWFYTYVSNFLIAREQRWIQPGHLWSLAVEEQFYVLWPMIVWLVAPRRLGLAMLATCTLAWGLRIFSYVGNVAPLSLYVLPWFRVDAFAWGALVALGKHRDTRWYRWIVSQVKKLTCIALVIFASGLAVHPFETRHWFWPVIGATTLYILAALLIILVLESKTLSSFLETWPLREMGRISYGLYVWHLVAVEVTHVAVRLGASKLNCVEITASTTGRIVLELPCALALSTALALLSWWLLEQPFLSLKQLWSYSR